MSKTSPDDSTDSSDSSAETPQNTPCDACGQTDDHPMIHVAFSSWKKDDRTTVSEPSFHYDCLPTEFRTQLDGPSHAVTNAAIEAAEAGTHGDDLREFIATQPSDNETDQTENGES